MELVLKSRNMKVTPDIESYVERKIGRLDRYMPDISEVRVDLGEEKSNRSIESRAVAQITVRHQRGQILRAEERTTDILSAVDAVVDKIYRQIERYKGKQRNRGEAGEEFAEYETAIQLEDEEFEPHTLLRRKSFSLDPMLEDEAIDQMDLLGHDFFVFVNASTNKVNVLYRRRDGNYGLLEPEGKI
jgi:putative sigma-54 modulation protein